MTSAQKGDGGHEIPQIVDKQYRDQRQDVAQEMEGN